MATAAAMTERQAAYRADLMAAYLDRLADEFGPEQAGRRYPTENGRARALAEAALIVAMPQPRDAREASAQIDALKGSIVLFARTAPWGQPTIDKVGAAIKAAGRVPTPDTETRQQGWVYPAGGGGQQPHMVAVATGATLRALAERIVAG